MNKEKIISNLEETLRLVKEYEFEHPPKDTEERPDVDGKNAKLLWYPLAKTDTTPMRTRGKYRKLYPEGAVVHFTAGRSLKGLQDAINSSNYGSKQGFTYFTIGNDGSVIQSFPLDEWGSHAGVSEWPGLGKSVSQYLVGIEVCCAGRLDANKVSWFGEKYDQVRSFTQDFENIQKGHYHKYTDAQENALVDLLLWLKHNNELFSFDYVVGHDECAVPKGRKNDPGGSLGYTMPKFREHLKAEYLKRYKV